MQKTPTPAPGPNNKRQTFRQDLEIPIEMKVTGYPVSVYGTLMDMSAEGCRVRSLIALEKGMALRFPIRGASGKSLELRGRIAARKKIVGQAFYEYGIAFDKIATADSDAVIQFIMEFQRRAAADRSEVKDAAVAAKPGAQRGTYRAVVAFPIKYRREGRPGATIAEANDLSAGGLRLICNEPMPADVVLALEFTLPQEVLSVFKGSHVTEDPSPFGNRGITRPKPKDPRRPFEPMTIRGKVAARLKDSSGRIVLGIQFMDADSFTREEIQRYIHAVQLYKIRTNVDNS